MICTTLRRHLPSLSLSLSHRRFLACGLGDQTAREALLQPGLFPVVLSAVQGAALDALSADPLSADTADIVALAGKAALHWACCQAGDTEAAIAVVAELADGTREMVAIAKSRPAAAAAATVATKVRAARHAYSFLCVLPEECCRDGWKED